MTISSNIQPKLPSAVVAADTSHIRLSTILVKPQEPIAELVTEITAYLFREIDTNTDGDINKTEYKKYLEKRSPLIIIQTELVDNFFNTINSVNGDPNILSRDEVRQYLVEELKTKNNEEIRSLKKKYGVK
jgi:hypothetical protein